jgi:osmotically-inducible protein OsmY
MSCKGTVKDSDIQAAINEKISSVPEMAGLTATVAEGIVTLSGECKDDACKSFCETTIKAVAGVKSVINNCSVAPVAIEPVVPLVSDALSQAISDAVKDFPGVKTDLKDGVLTLTGEVGKEKLQTLMMGLNALKSLGLKKIESSNLVKK